MFELSQSKSTTGSLTEFPESPEVRSSVVDDIEAIAFLSWGEHCIECAAPACYSTCDLYDPRSDFRCRRFQYGSVKNTAFDSIRGYAVEVVFKKWGKLEALGSTDVFPVHTVLRWERLMTVTGPLTNLAGRVVHRLNGDLNWAALSYETSERVVRKLQKRRHSARADAFLLEIYNPMPYEVRLQVIFAVSKTELLKLSNPGDVIPPVIHTVTLASGYSRHQFDAHETDRFVTKGIPFLVTLVPEAEQNARLIFLSGDFVKFRTQALPDTPAKQIKCVVWDMDNTLWDGVLIEGDDVKLRPDIAELLKYLDERGILQSIASKNDHDTAWEKLTSLGVADYFLYPQIDWFPKSQKISTIAKRLNLGLDAFAFVDDNPFELGEVSGALPEIVCILADDTVSLINDPRFQGSVTEESKNRRLLYKGQVAREEGQESFAADYFGFLESCEIELELSDYSEKDCDRVAELVQRTNQLNFSGRKYTRNELRDVIDDRSLQKFVLRCSDKYGSYGTVGFAIVRQDPAAIEILDFMLSCRVQGKFIEQAFLAHLLAHHNPYGAAAVWVNFRKTDRNTPAGLVLESLDFEIVAQNGKAKPAGGMIRDRREPIRADFINIRCSVDGNLLINGRTVATPV